MIDENELAKHRATIGSGAAFTATRQDGFAMVTPITARAEAWLIEHVDEEATWVGPTLMVEMPYFPMLADAIIAAGFLFERDAFPN